MKEGRKEEQEEKVRFDIGLSLTVNSNDTVRSRKEQPDW